MICPGPEALIGSDLTFPVAFGAGAVIALAQAQAWASVALEALRRPRGSAFLEGARVFVVAALPTLVLAPLAARAANALAPPLPGWFVLSAPASAALTAALVCHGAALGLRVRRAGDSEPAPASGPGGR
jgi:hypothetical protein